MCLMSLLAKALALVLAIESALEIENKSKNTKYDTEN